MRSTFEGAMPMRSSRVKVPSGRRSVRRKRASTAAFRDLGPEAQVVLAQGTFEEGFGSEVEPLDAGAKIEFVAAVAGRGEGTKLQLPLLHAERSGGGILPISAHSEKFHRLDAGQSAARAQRDPLARALFIECDEAVGERPPEEDAFGGKSARELLEAEEVARQIEGPVAEAGADRSHGGMTREIGWVGRVIAVVLALFALPVAVDHAGGHAPIPRRCREAIVEALIERDVRDLILKTNPLQPSAEGARRGSRCAGPPCRRGRRSRKGWRRPI